MNRLTALLTFTKIGLSSRFLSHVRYEDVLPYKDTVVRLRRVGGLGSDYINANFVQDGTTCKFGFCEG
jgi:protein tyrosine phosphatase